MKAKSKSRQILQGFAPFTFFAPPNASSNHHASTYCGSLGEWFYLGIYAGDEDAAGRATRQRDGEGMWEKRARGYREQAPRRRPPSDDEDSVVEVCARLCEAFDQDAVGLEVGGRFAQVKAHEGRSDSPTSI